MSAGRRDKQLTSRNFATLGQQIEGLYRHVPLDAQSFATYVPRLARTLSPHDVGNALATLRALIDEIPPSKKVDALKVLLGFSDIRDNVLERKTAFAPDVNPITPARWARDVVEGPLLALIQARFVQARADALVNFSVQDGMLEIWSLFHSNVPMEQGQMEIEVSDRQRPARREDLRKHSADFELDATSDAEWDTYHDGELLGLRVKTETYEDLMREWRKDESGWHRLPPRKSQDYRIESFARFDGDVHVTVWVHWSGSILPKFICDIGTVASATFSEETVMVEFRS